MQFAFKPALLAARVHVALDASGLSCSDAAGEEHWCLDWSDIAGAAVVCLAVKGYQMRRLDLLDDDGRRLRSLSCTSPTAVRPDEDTNAAAHIELMVAVLDRLAGRDPDMSVQFGEYGRYRHAIFAVGVVSLLGGLGLGLAAVMTGVATDKLAAAAVPVLLLSLLGATLVRNNAPWTPPITVSPALMAKTLRAMLKDPDEAAEIA